MGLIYLANHLFNLLLPAMVVGPLVAWAGPWFTPRPSWGWLRQSLLNTGLGMAALLGGLVFWGTDAKMASYLALVLVVGSGQWLASARSRS